MYNIALVHYAISKVIRNYSHKINGWIKRTIFALPNINGVDVCSGSQRKHWSKAQVPQICIWSRLLESIYFYTLSLVLIQKGVSGVLTQSTWLNCMPLSDTARQKTTLVAQGQCLVTHVLTDASLCSCYSPVHSQSKAQM